MRPLVISMGFNGYQWMWRRVIESHKAYCDKYGYDYLFVEKPSFTTLTMECAWLKIPLILSALSSGREWAFFIDSDAVIAGDCPPIESLGEPGKSLFMVNGYSGRLNSGVIVARNEPEVRELLSKILESALMPLPPEDDIGWGENGHVLHYAKKFPGLKVLGTEWNNNQDPNLKDYVRHYSAGPMRHIYKFTWLERLMERLTFYYSRILARIVPPSEPRRFYGGLNTLMNIVTATYPMNLQWPPNGASETIGAAPMGAN